MPTFVLTEGPDYFSWDNNQNIEVFGLGGNDRIASHDGSDSLFGGAGNDRLFGDDDEVGGGSDDLHGGAGNDHLNGNYADDILYGEDGDDDLYGEHGDDRVFGGDGDDYASGNNGNDYIDGGSGDDYLSGGDDHDEIFGGTGADVLRGNAGNDRLIAVGSFTDGPDVLFGFEGNDVYVLSGAGVFDIRSTTEAADPGVDRIECSFDIDITNLRGVENVTLLYSGHFDVTGNDRDNVIIGNFGGNALSGAAGADQLFGQAGADTLDGGLGADDMFGGAGDDDFVVDSVFDRVFEDANAGVDEIFSTISLSLASRPNIENLYLRDAALTATGNGLRNYLQGNSQANTLDGGLGYDTLAGGLGHDVYYLNDATLVSSVPRYDWVVEAPSSGADTIYVGRQPNLLTGGFITSYTLDAHVESGRVLGAGDFDLRGNGENNQLYGNQDANRLTGYAGNDILHSFGGADLLDGGEGADSFDGGDGIDTMVGGVGNDSYVLRDTNRITFGGFSFYEYDTIVEGVGGGTDTLYIYQAANPFLPGGLTTSYTLGANIENGIVVSSGAFNLGGNILDNVLTGNDQANSIGGGAAGNDTLNGMGGGDFLDGGPGVDIMYGGTGEDIYVADSSADKVIEYSNSGIDAVIARTSFTLGPNVENLSLFGSANLAGTGNSLANFIQGQDGNNVLKGLDGSDALQGFNGDDLLYGGGSTDTLIGGAGFDRFFFDTTPHSTLNYDTIIDFDPVQDTIVLENAVFTALTATGWLAPAAFRLGANALDADDRILYDAATGQLIYDSNGVAAGGRVVFADIGLGLAVTNWDFLVQ